MLIKRSAFLMLWLTTFPMKMCSGNCTCPQNTINAPTKLKDQIIKDDPLEKGTEKKRKRCCPYNFDGKICRNVGDRVLCGYNRNVGRPEINDEDLDLKNGCRIRQGRLECGYNQPPYLNSRRPSGWDYPGLDGPQDKTTIILEDLSKENKPQKLYLKNTIMPRLTTRCVEIKERIVCRQI